LRAGTSRRLSKYCCGERQDGHRRNRRPAASPRRGWRVPHA
jgi:hypothetical protein